MLGPVLGAGSCAEPAGEAAPSTALHPQPWGPAEGGRTAGPWNDPRFSVPLGREQERARAGAALQWDEGSAKRKGRCVCVICTR